VVGLNNPGVEFEGTRHNAGALAVEILATRLGVEMKRDRAAKCRIAGTHVNISGQEADRSVLLAVPLVYMNASGIAVRSIMRRCALDDFSSLVVVHDEMDIEPGRVKISVGGGAAGHNGILSIQAHLHTSDFTRVRIGIGKPRSREAGAGYVLSRPRGMHRREFNDGVHIAADALEVILSQGVEAAMRMYN
jgi:PTH1 family peptidyl-tRNA hydrolase